MLHRKQSKMESVIKKAKLNFTFEITLYLDHFTSVSLIKQGHYFVMATLDLKDSHKSQNKATSTSSFFKTESSRVFRIKYNNHTEVLAEAFYFTFTVESNLHEYKNNNKLFLLFQLFRCRSESGDEPETKLISEYEPVSHSVFQIKSNQELSFIQYFDVRFQMPYASEMVGTITCLMTNFQLMVNQNLLVLEKELFQEKRINKVQSYFELVSRLKKMAKNYRFMSYTVQKAIEATFSGFEAALMIPSSSPKRSPKQLDLSLLTYENENTSMIESSEKELNINQQSLIQVPKGFADKIMNYREKKCNEQQFMSYLAFAEYQDKKLEVVIDELKSIGRRNKEIIKQVFNLLSQKQKVPGNANLENLRLQYQNKRSILYSQKTTYFGSSLVSAAEEMKSYLKHLVIFKSKEKQNYFTDMNKLFHVNPSSNFQGDSLKFDKCPYVFYSHESFYQGVKAQVHFEDLMDCNIQVKQKPVKNQEFRNVFVLAHGYQASCGNMQRIKISLKKIFPRSKILILKSYSQQMDRTLQEMGQKSAQQIEAYITQLSQNSNRKIRLIMVGHSMGGIILRASLPFLDQKTKKTFHTFLSIATPHLGYLHCKNFLTETGIKLIEMMHPSISLRQLSNKDNTNVKQTFIYKLASLGSLKEFENVVVLSSIEDKYVPWNSARIQLYKEPEGVAGKNTTGGWSMNSEKHYLRFVEQEMLNHLLGIGQKDSQFRSIHRFEIDFHINQINLDAVIGRTAHVAFLANEHIMPIIFENCLRKTLHAELLA